MNCLGRYSTMHLESKFLKNWEEYVNITFMGIAFTLVAVLGGSLQGRV